MTVIETTSVGNVIQGNNIGVDVAGNARLGNGGIGVDIVSGTNTIIGGPGVARNVISGFGTGIQVRTNASGTVIRGNNIGTNAAGTAPIGNGVGITIHDAVTGTIIGGTAPGEGNVVSGNAGMASRLATRLRGHPRRGQPIGTDVTGRCRLPANTADGVNVTLASNNTSAEPAPARENIIAFNGGRGVNIQTGIPSASAGTRSSVTKTSESISKRTASRQMIPVTLMRREQPAELPGRDVRDDERRPDDGRRNAEQHGADEFTLRLLHQRHVRRLGERRRPDVCRPDDGDDERRRERELPD